MDPPPLSAQVREPRQLFAQVRDRQGSFLAGKTFTEAVAFISGYDFGRDGMLLAGFQGWLVTKTMDRPEVAWPGQVAHLAFPQEPDRWGTAGLTDDELEHLRQTLFRLLDDFLAERDARGLILIHDDYLTWLKGQSWYDRDRFPHQ